MVAHLSRMLWTVRSRTDQASLWKQTTTEVAGSCCTALYRSGALHHSSRGSGSVRCTEIMSDTY